MMNNKQAQLTSKYDAIKLGIDWHARSYRVARLIDNGGPEPAQKFTPEAFLAWVKKQQGLAREVITCYEAGPGGYVLHRQLTALGVKNIVVTPRKLDPNCRRVVNDKTDAMELVQNLDRWHRGNKKALREVHVPSCEMEEARCVSRQRKALQKTRLRISSQGRTLLLAQGWIESNNWWKPRRWLELRPQLPEWIIGLLERLREVVLLLDVRMGELARQIAGAAPESLPKGMGSLTHEELVREVGDFGRFKNRKAPGSYAGLTGGVEASGESHRDLSITKAGSRRLRTILVETAWRFAAYQPQSRTMKKWAPILKSKNSRARKKAIVAAARTLFVDIWRWKTGRASVEELGWIMTATPEAN